MIIINTRKHFFESFGLLSSFSWYLASSGITCCFEDNGLHFVWRVLRVQ